MPKKSPQPKARQPLYVRIIASNGFFWGVVALFIVNALWIGLSAAYPMIFDEEFHLGIIEIYSRQWSPFITHQTAETIFHGDLTRYGSYLFHYLMSFPYRIITMLTSDFAAQVIWLRIINIGLVAASLWLYRKVLLLGGFSSALSNLAIFFFSLVPLVPYTAAHINYDNLIILLTAAIFYATLKSLKSSPHQVIWLGATLSIGLLGSLVKFTFLPVFVAATLFIVISLWRQSGKKLISRLAVQLKKLSKPAAVLLVGLVLLSAGLFTERYGVNLVQYRSLEPKCHRVHSEELCSQYNIWRRNMSWKKQYQEDPWQVWRPLQYTFIRWVPHIFNDLFITAAYTGGEIELRKPLGTLEASAGTKTLRALGWTMFISSLLIGLIFWRKLRLRQVRYLFISVIGLYAAALWFKNYTDYLTYGIPVATQGRYFIPFLIPLIAMAGYSFSVAIKKRLIKGVLLAIALLLMTQGAGATTYILFSRDNWYWPNQTVRDINHSAKTTVKLFIFRP